MRCRDMRLINYLKAIHVTTNLKLAWMIEKALHQLTFTASEKGRHFNSFKLGLVSCFLSYILQRCANDQLVDLDAGIQVITTKPYRLHPQNACTVR